MYLFSLSNKGVSGLYTYWHGRTSTVPTHLPAVNERVLWPMGPLHELCPINQIPHLYMYIPRSLYWPIQPFTVYICGPTSPSKYGLLFWNLFRMKRFYNACTYICIFQGCFVDVIWEPIITLYRRSIHGSNQVFS